MQPDNLESRKFFGLIHGFKVCTGARYLGTFIGDDDSKYEWLKYVRQHESRTFARSAKQQGETVNKFTPQWYMKSI